jgi:hypothetical protein
MSWPASLLIALLTGAFGLLAAGFVMSVCVVWYQVSSFEGRAGFAVVTVALLGGLAGLVLGLIVARVMPGEGFLAFLRALGVAWGVAALLAGLGAGIAYLRADLPPTIDGQELMLELEIRLPADVQQAPASLEGESWIQLGALSGRVQRRGEHGNVHLADARQEDGRWIVPASVFIFTSRGQRLLSVQIGDGPIAGCILPLPARPGKEHLEWSGWETLHTDPEPSEPDAQWSFRFRVSTLEPEPDSGK